VLRQSRLKSSEGQDLIDVLIRRLQSHMVSASDISYIHLTRSPTDNRQQTR
jgi:hypothetical protein